MAKWKRDSEARACFLEDKKGELIADIYFMELTIYKDPRTGKPWTSMKAAREWFDEVCLDEQVKRIME